MDREECERLICEKLIEIQKIYKEYNPKGEYLNLTIFNEGVSFNNARWKGGEDEDKPINYLWRREDRNGNL